MLRMSQVHAVGAEQRGHPSNGKEAGAGGVHGEDAHRGLSPLGSAHRDPAFDPPAVREVDVEGTVKGRGLIGTVWSLYGLRQGVGVGAVVSFIESFDRLSFRFKSRASVSPDGVASEGNGRIFLQIAAPLVNRPRTSGPPSGLGKKSRCETHAFFSAWSIIGRKRDGVVCMTRNGTPSGFLGVGKSWARTAAPS